MTETVQSVIATRLDALSIPSRIDTDSYPSIVALFEEALSTYRDEAACSSVGHSLTYADLAGVSFHLNRGVPLIAAHGDLNCPTPDGGVPDVGSFLAMFNAANDVEPVQVCGKPDPGMLLRHMAEHELRPRSCAMIGDRLYTDMRMAIDAAVASVLVLSGEATQADLDASGMEVDLVVNSVDMLLR